jgi:ribose transport system permease protein
MTAVNTPTVSDDQKLSPSRGRRRGAEGFALVGVWIIIIIVFSLVKPDLFPTTANLSNMLGSQAVLLILALGLMIPLRVGDYDLSVASSLNLSAMIVAVLNTQHHWGVGYAAIVGVLAAMAVGVTNGLIIVRFNIDPFIVTLGVSTVVQGLIYLISGSATITGVSSSLSTAVLDEPFLSIPVDFYYAIALCAVLWYVFDYTPLGQRLLFLGQNRDMARLNGIGVGRLRVTALIASATIAGLAGVVYAGTTASSDPVSGQGFLLPAFAACYLGSTTLKVGRFNPWGTTIAVYFLVTGITGLQLLGAQQYVQQLFYGGALVIAVVASTLVKSRGNRQRQPTGRRGTPSPGGTGGAGAGQAPSSGAIAAQHDTGKDLS